MNSDTLGACGYHEGGKVTAWDNVELQKLWFIRKSLTQPEGVTTAGKTGNLEYYVNFYFIFIFSIDEMLRFIQVLCRQNHTLMWTINLETLGLSFRSVVNHIS